MALAASTNFETDRNDGFSVNSFPFNFNFNFHIFIYPISSLSKEKVEKFIFPPYEKKRMKAMK